MAHSPDRAVSVLATPAPMRASRYGLLVYAALALIVAAPVAFVRVPCLGDYLNHLARIHVLQAVGHSAVLQRYYENTWQFVPYMAMDVPVSTLSKLVGLECAGRIFIVVCLLMPPAAAFALYYALYRRFSLQPALAFLVSYNYILARGFLTYLFSAGLAVLLFAGWIAAGRMQRPLRAAIFIPAATLLYAAHIFAFAAYGLMLATYELGRALAGGRARWRSHAADLAEAGAQAVPALMLAAFVHASGLNYTSRITQFGQLAAHLGALMSPFLFPGPKPVAAIFVLIPFLLLLAVRRVSVAAGLALPLGALLVVMVFMPETVLNIWGTDLRFPIIAVIVGIGGVAATPRLPPAMIVAPIVALCAGRSWFAYRMLHAADMQAAEVRDVLRALPVGSRLLVAEAPGDAPGRVAPANLTNHVALFATIDRDAFVPFLFTGINPLVLRPDMVDSASTVLEAITLDQLNQSYGKPAPPVLPAYGLGGHEYWLGWQQKFDYVLILPFGAAIGPVPATLLPVAQNPVAALYAIGK